MPSPNHPQGNSDPDPPAKRPREPLYIRMYFQNHLVDLVRLFGYDEIPLERAREKLKPLIDKYGQKILEEAVEEIIFIDGAKTPAVARLTDHARTLARQLLGRPPDSEPASTVASSAEPSRPAPPDAVSPTTIPHGGTAVDSTQNTGNLEPRPRKKRKAGKQRDVPASAGDTDRASSQP